MAVIPTETHVELCPGWTGVDTGSYAVKRWGSPAPSSAATAPAGRRARHGDGTGDDDHDDDDRLFLDGPTPW